jgi:hypothetical protein
MTAIKHPLQEFLARETDEAEALLARGDKKRGPKKDNSEAQAKSPDPQIGSSCTEP